MTDAIVNVGLGAIKALASKYKKLAKTYQAEWMRIGADFGPPDELARFYVEPDCQSMNPAEVDIDSRAPVPRSPVLRHIAEFIQLPHVQRDGSSVLFVLGDAGTGKTSLLVMLKLLQLSRLWPPRYRFCLLKLGRTTLDEIAQIHDKANTILLLDSLDEDQVALGGSNGIAKRMEDLLECTTSFRRTIITCRTQFFISEGRDVIERDGWINFRGYRCPTAYLSLFSDEQVDTYLRKRFRRSWLQRLMRRNDAKHQQAKRLVELMRSLRCRPMLLSYTEDLVSSGRPFSSEYEVYDILVEMWLMREVRKMRAMGTSVTTAQLRESVVALAFFGQLYQSWHFSADDVRVVGEHASVELEKVDLGGRSLLNLTSDKRYRFSHFSFREFLVADLIARNPKSVPSLIELFENDPRLDKPSVPPTCHTTMGTGSVVPTRRQFKLSAPHWTPLLERFVLQVGCLEEAYLPCAELNGKDLGHVKLNRTDLRSSSMCGANFTRGEMKAAELTKAQLRDSIFRDTTMVEAILEEADIRGARFERTNLRNANLQRIVAGPELADVQELTHYIEAAERQNRPNFGNLADEKQKLMATRVSFHHADLCGANLEQASLCYAILEDCNLTDATLVGARLCSASLVRSNLTGADLAGADLTGANLKGAVLWGTNLAGAVLADADLTDVDLSRADLTGAILTRSGFAGDSTEEPGTRGRYRLS